MRRCEGEGGSGGTGDHEGGSGGGTGDREGGVGFFFPQAARD